MSQNLVSLVFTKDQQAAVLALIVQILQMMVGTITLEADESRDLTHMGTGSDRFVRIVLVALRQNPDILPRNFDIDEAFRDLEALDNLAPVILAVQQLLTRLMDTRMALGSDLIVAANRGYSLMKANGNADGLEEALNEASYRYAKKRRKPRPENEDDSNQ